MGNDMDQHRAAIGVFNFRGPRYKKRFVINSDGSSPFQVGEGGKNVIYFLLITIWILAECMGTHPNPGPTAYRRPTICHVNIYSLDCGTRMESIRTQLAGNFDIITVSETWLEPSDASTKFKLDGYNGPFRHDRPIKGGGGVLAWVASDFVTKRRLDLESPDLETVFLEIRAKTTRFLIGVAYRQPRGHYADSFWESLQDSMDTARTATLPIILLGDFNADRSTNIPAADRLILFMESNSHTLLQSPLLAYPQLYPQQSEKNQ